MQGFFKSFVIVVLIHLIVIGGIVLCSQKKSDEGTPVVDIEKRNQVEERKVAEAEKNILPEEKVAAPLKAPQPAEGKIRFPLKGHTVKTSAPQTPQNPADAAAKPSEVKGDAPLIKKPEVAKVEEPPKKVPVKTGKLTDAASPEKTTPEPPKKTPVKIGKRIERSDVGSPKVETPKKVPVKIGKRVGGADRKSVEVKRTPTISEQIKNRESELDAWLKGRERVPVQTGQASDSVGEPVYNY